MPAAIIFDMDGTLVDSEIIWDEAEREMFAERGLVYNQAIREQVIGLRLDEFFSRLIKIFDMDESVDALIAELVERMLAKIPQKVLAKEGAQRIIDWAAAQNIPYCIASSSPMAIITATVEAQGWQDLIPQLYSANQVEKGKPAPDIYLYAAQQLGVDPAQCVAIEDSPNGAKSAVAAGMTCYVVPDSHSDPARFADITPHIYATLDEVLAILREDKRA